MSATAMTSSRFQARPTKKVKAAVGAKKAMATMMAPATPPAQSPMGTIIIMFGPGASCPTL